MEMKRKGLFAHHALSDKEWKNLLILELIRKRGPISRSAISEITDINPVSVSNYINKYIEKKLVVETGHADSTGGRRPELVKLNTDGLHVIGLDVGKAELRAVVSDFSFRPIAKLRTKRPGNGMDALLDAAMALVRDICSNGQVPMETIAAIGLGVLNEGAVVHDAIEKRFNIPTFIGSDASCAAFGEKKLNPNTNVENLLFMYSDVGCGIVVSGDIYFGSGGSAGETHLHNESSPKDENAIFNHLQYLRPWNVDLGITKAARQEIERGVGTIMVALTKGRLDDLSIDVVIEAALQRDEIALSIIQNAAKNLGVRIAYLVNLFNPEIVVVGGGMERGGESVLGPIRDSVKKFAFTEQASMVRIMPSGLGDEAVSLGAACLTVRELFLSA